MDVVQLVSFILLILGGHIALPTLLLTFLFSKSVTRRSATLINFLLCTVEYATALLLLFYAGDVSSAGSSFVLCRLQAAMVHASGPLCSAAGVALMAETLEHVSRPDPSIRTKPMKAVVLIAVPWMIFLGFFLAFFLEGLHVTPEEELRLIRDPFFYCRSPHGAILSLSFAVEIMGLACIILTEVFIAMRVGFRAGQAKADGVVLPLPFWHLLLRGLILSVYCVVTMCVVFFLNTFGGGDQVAYVMLSLTPLVAFLLFGTQRDVLRVWFCYAPIFDPPILPASAVYIPRIVDGDLESVVTCDDSKSAMEARWVIATPD